MTCSEKDFAKTNLSVFRLHRTTAQSGSVAQLEPRHWSRIYDAPCHSQRSRTQMRQCMAIIPVLEG